MARIILTCDLTLVSDFRRLPLGPFLSCAPAERIPEFFFDWIAHPQRSDGGTATYAPYGLRKVEAALLRSYDQKDVIIAHPKSVERFIDEDTRIVGISTMDPLGLGPVSTMFTMGGLFTAYSKKKFLELVGKVNKVRRSSPFKLVVGGPGVWQLLRRTDVVKNLKIDHIIQGEIDHVAHELFHRIEEEDLPPIIEIKDRPKPDEIPPIVRPSVQGLVEVMRGCGRNCEFCDVNLRSARYIDLAKIRKEVGVNVEGGFDHIWVQSDDIFLYRLEDHKNFYPNRDAVLELFSSIMSTKGVAWSNPTHGTLAPIAADPLLIEKLSKLLRAGPERFVGIQPGIETGSSRLMARYMPSKVKPFSPEEWSDVVLEATRILNENYWFPAYTLIVGLPGETEDDAWETVRLIDRMEKELPKRVGDKAHFTITPLGFVPVGTMTDENFFDFSRSIDEARFMVIYKSWRHSVLELERLPSRILKFNPIFRSIFYQFLRLGAQTILWSIKRWGKQMGFDPERAESKL